MTAFGSISDGKEEASLAWLEHWEKVKKEKEEKGITLYSKIPSTKELFKKKINDQ